jgi:hypothetical protein
MIDYPLPTLEELQADVERLAKAGHGYAWLSVWPDRYVVGAEPPNCPYHDFPDSEASVDLRAAIGGKRPAERLLGLAAQGLDGHERSW